MKENLFNEEIRESSRKFIRTDKFKKRQEDRLHSMQTQIQLLTINP